LRSRRNASITRFLLRMSRQKLRPKNQKSPGMALPLGLPWQVTELRLSRPKLRKNQKSPMALPLGLPWQVTELRKPLQPLFPAAKMRAPLRRRVEIKVRQLLILCPLYPLRPLRLRMPGSSSISIVEIQNSPLPGGPVVFVSLNSWKSAASSSPVVSFAPTLMLVSYGSGDNAHLYAS